jgi:hypothetical protein
LFLRSVRVGDDLHGDTLLALFIEGRLRHWACSISN